MNRNLHRVADKQKVLTHITQESLSLVNMSRVEIKANRNKLNKAIDEINRLDKEIVDVEAVSENTWSLMRTYTQGLIIFGKIKSNVETLFRHLEDMKLRVNMLSLGRLTPVVIKPGELLTMLLAIRNQLTPPLMMIREPETNLWHYYKTLKVSTVIHNQRLIVLISIPLINANSRLELFRIHNLPFPGQGEFSSVVAKYDIKAYALAVNSERTEYLRLSEHDFRSCVSNPESYCEFNRVRHLMGTDRHCEAVLFMRRKQGRSRVCELQVISNMTFPWPEFIHNGLWAVGTKEAFTMTESCGVPGKRRITIKPPMTMFRLNDTCVVSSSYFTIPARHVFKSRVNIEDHAEPLLEINIKNVSYWRGLENSVDRGHVRKALTKLKSLNKYSMNQLMAEISALRNEQDDTYQEWYTGGGVGIGLLVLLILIMLGVRKFRKGRGREKTESSEHRKNRKEPGVQYITGADDAIIEENRREYGQ